MRFQTKNGVLIAQVNGETLRIEPWGKDSLRVRATMLPEFSGKDWALTEVPEKTEAKAEQFEVDHLEIDGSMGKRTSASITNGKIRAVVNFAGVITFYKEEQEILREYHRCYDGTISKESRCLKTVNREWKGVIGGSEYGLNLKFESNDEEKIFGMGQYQQKYMDLKGCTLELAQRNSQISVPFAVSSLGYGMLWNNPAVGQVTFGKNYTEWTARSTKDMDYWLTAADTPKEILENYTAVTGRAPKFPEDRMGLWQCKLRYYNQEQVLSIAREYKKRNIPLDVIVIDFYHWPYCGDWRFDEEFFPDPAAMIKELQELGVETMVSIWPAVDFRSENYEEMKQQNMLVKSNSGVDVQMIFHGNNAFMDATNPKTRRYVWEKCKQNYADLGIRTFWLDVAEPEYTSYDFENYRYYSGTVLETGNIYPREYARLFYEGQKENGQDDIVNLIRCAWAGSQRYGALVWSGDIMSTYEDFRKQICAGIHMGLSGIPWWTTDIGGFHNGVAADPDFKELLIRWFQFGTFCPVMRLHGSRQPYTPIYNKAGELREGTGTDNEVWSYGEEAYQIMTKFIHVRELMRDYTRSLMQQAHENGHPVLRALFYEFPSDPICWDIKDSYLFGSDLLVAPICHEHAVDRQVYLPAGISWTDARTGVVYEGGQWITANAPMDTLPVFLRDGRQDYLIGEI